MTRDIIELARGAGWEMPVEWDANCLSYNDGFLMRLKRFADILEAKVRKECAELCRAEANGRSPLAFDALHECADLILEGYEE